MPTLLLLLFILCGPHASSDNVVSRMGLDPHARWLHTHGSAETNRRSNELRPEPETSLICHAAHVYVTHVSFMTCYDCSKCICFDQKNSWDDQTTAKFFQDLILRTNDTQHFLRYVSVTDQGLYILQWMHCLAVCFLLDLESGRSKNRLLLSVSWALSAKERNRLAHALNGNTPLSVIFYGDSSCYCKDDKKIKKGYGGIWEKLGWNFAKPLIQYKAGATIAEVAEMLENGEKVDVIVVFVG